MSAKRTGKKQPRDDWRSAPQSDAPLEGEVESSSLTEAVTTAFRSTVEATKEQASQLASDVGDELASTLTQEKRRGAESMRGFADAIDTAGQRLAAQSPLAARTLGSAARSVESLSRKIENRNVRELYDEANSFARARPLAFFAGAVIAGFAATRFLRSSASTPVRRNAPGEFPD